MRVANHTKPWWYIISTEVPHKPGVPGGPGCQLDVERVRIGYANDTVKVSCSCGGRATGLTYAKPKNRRK